MKVITIDATQTQALAAKILEELPHHNIIALYGELGSGKTTFTQELAKKLGITKRVLSPTYILMRQYQIKNHPAYNSMTHLDLYRLSSTQDLKSIDLEELAANPKNLVVIEWAEKAARDLPPHLAVHFKIINEHTREITVSLISNH